MPGEIGVFISYSFEIESLAKKLKDKLQVLDDENILDVFIASELGGRRWREEIHGRLRSDRILILPYPHQNMKLDWVCYELGAFWREGTPICIMNTHLDTPPDQISEWEAYKAEAGDLRRFFVDLFERGQFTGGRAINPRLTSVPEFKQRLKDAIAEIETEFAAFRLEEKFYAHRIKILTPPTVSPTGAKLPSKLIFERAVVKGNSETLDIFQVQNGVTWRTFKGKCESYSNTAWLQEIEGMLHLSREKILAHTLTPFRTNVKRTFIPLVSRIQSIEGTPAELNVIFVELTGDTRIWPELMGQYEGMPPNWNVLFTLLDLGRRFRWEILDPVEGALRGRLRHASAEEWKAEAQSVLKTVTIMQKQLSNLGMRGEDQFFMAFDRDIRKTLVEKMAGYQGAEDAYAKAITDGNLDQTLRELARVSQFNADFLEHTIRQIHQLAKELN